MRKVNGITMSVELIDNRRISFLGGAARTLTMRTIGSEISSLPLANTVTSVMSATHDPCPRPCAVFATLFDF